MLISNLRLVFGHTILLPLRPAKSYQPAWCDCLNSPGGSGHQSQPAQRGMSLAETRNLAAAVMTHPLTHVHARFILHSALIQLTTRVSNFISAFRMQIFANRARNWFIQLKKLIHFRRTQMKRT